MADVKISELTALTTPDGAEELVVNDSGTTKKIRIDDLFAGDNVKAKFGASDDLLIHHDGANSYIQEVGTGDLNILADSLALRSTAFEYYVKCDVNGVVQLYHDSAAKLATTSTGVDVTGNVSLSGDITSTDNIEIQANGFGKGITLKRGNGAVKGLDVSSGGDISFYEDTGTTAKFFWDASAERLGIGTSSPTTALDVTGTVTADGLTVHGTDNTNQANIGTAAQGVYFKVNGTNVDLNSSGNAAGSFTFSTGNTERARIDSSGNLLVGTTNASLGTGGIQLNASGRIGASASSLSPIILNRKTSDGTIIDLRKDSTTVGSIGTKVSDITIGTGDTGLVFNASGDAIVPFNMSTNAGRDNVIDLGISTFRFDDIYATNGTIQTSDRNEKQDIQAITEAESRVAQACKGLLRSFRWKDAVLEKGDNARIHFGIIAQDLRDAFTAEGLDAGNYAMFISSTWWEAERTVDAVPAQEAVYETVVVTPAQEAGFREVSPAIEASPAYYDIDGNVIKEAVEAQNAVHEPTEAVAEVTEQRLVSEAVEAVDAYTVTDTFDTLEEAPEGATERTRMGVRYPELLAFIIAAM